MKSLNYACIIIFSAIGIAGIAGICLGAIHHVVTVLFCSLIILVSYLDNKRENNY